MKKSNEQRLFLVLVLFAIIFFGTFLLGFFVGYTVKDRKVITVEKKFGKIDAELIGDCLNKNGCLLVLRNTGIDTINTTDIEIYKDNEFYGTVNTFKDDNNISFSQISANRAITIRVGNICNDTDSVSVISKVKPVNNTRVTAWYKSTILCPEDLSSYEQSK